MSRDMEKAKANTRKRYAANPEKFRAAGRARYAKNREACMASSIAWQKANPEKMKAIELKRAMPRRLKKYGLTAAEYTAMFNKQLRRCAICRDPQEDGGRWCIDHCHENKFVRGILCHACNVSLGLIKENPETARRMADYIEEYMAHTGEDASDTE